MEDFFSVLWIVLENVLDVELEFGIDDGGQSITVFLSSGAIDHAVRYALDF
jgi:hypothetical protein